MSSACLTERAVSSAKPLGVALLVALAAASCGGTRARKSTVMPFGGREPPASHNPPARIPPAQPAAMMPTPRTALTLCRRSPLMRPICPRQIPKTMGTNVPRPDVGYGCNRATNGGPRSTSAGLALYPSKSCVDAGWFFLGGRTRIVHVDNEAASIGSAPVLVRNSPWAEGAHPVTDALLNPKRSRAVSLGWVRWYGNDGQLVLEPPGMSEWSDHLIFYIPPNARGMSYAITLHADWKHLAKVAATLKAVVGSTSLAR